MNPLRKIRRERKLTVTQMAQLAGLSGTRIYQLEHGHAATLPESMRKAVKLLGYNPDRVAKQYDAWRHEQIEKTLAWADRSGGGGGAA